MLFDLVKKVKGIPLINAVPNTLSLSEDDPRIQRYLLTIDDHDFRSLCAMRSVSIQELILMKGSLTILKVRNLLDLKSF